MGNNHRTIYLLTAIYLLWLLAVLFIFGYTPTNDGVGYIELAQQCLAEHTIYPTTTIYRQEPFVWNIGIINLTELCLWLTGSIMPLLVLLCLLKAATALFLALTTRQLFSSQAAIIVLLLFMLYPNNWGQSTMVSSEIPSTCLAMLAVFLVCGTYKTYKTYIPYILAGLLLGLANWFRPTATIFILAIALWLIIERRNICLRATASLLAGYALFVVVAGTSCYLRTGHFVYQARSYWFFMVDECYDEAPVAPHWGQPVWPEGTPRYIENHEQLDCFQMEEIWRDRSLSYLKDHKLHYLSKLPGRLYYMYQSDYDNLPAFLGDKSKPENNFITLPYRHLLSEASTLSPAQWLAALCQLFYAILLIMAIVGTVRALRQGQWQPLLLPLTVVVGGTLLLILVMHGETRFKDPLMPFWLMLAATSILPLLSKSFRRP